jgi:hypothetical protein
LKFCSNCTVCLRHCPPPVCSDKQADRQIKISASENSKERWANRTLHVLASAETGSRASPLSRRLIWLRGKRLLLFFRKHGICTLLLLLYTHCRKAFFTQCRLQLAPHLSFFLSFQRSHWFVCACGACDNNWPTFECLPRDYLKLGGGSFKYKRCNRKELQKE